MGIAGVNREIISGRVRRFMAENFRAFFVLFDVAE